MAATAESGAGTPLEKGHRAHMQQGRQPKGGQLEQIAGDQRKQLADVARSGGSLARLILADRVAILYRHARGGVPVTGLAAALMVWSLAQGASANRYWHWLASMLAVLTLRAIDLHLRSRAGERAHQQPEMWRLRFAIGNLATSVCWAAFLVLYLPDFDRTGQLIAITIYAAMAGGGVATLAASQLLASFYATMMLLPASIVMSLQPGLTGKAIGVLGVVDLAVLLYTISSTYHSLLRALQLSRESERLNLELRRARLRLLDSNVALEAKVRSRTAELEREVAERRSYQAELEYLANSDSLTGLANRARLHAEARRQLQHCTQMAVMFVDIDRFKQVNDGLGHSAGDEILRAIAARLSACAAPGSLVSRWGGDEFVLLLPERSPTEALHYAEQLLNDVCQPIEAGGGRLVLGASIGLSGYPEDGNDFDRLVRSADLAAYQAKRDGGGLVRQFRCEWGVAADERLRMARALREAIEDNRLSLVFQPIVDVRTARPSTYEALCRWRRADGVEIPPSAFIPVAEDSGLMPPLGAWVLREACRSMQPHCTMTPGTRVAVNLSLSQLRAEDFTQMVDDVLTETGLPGSCLELEITESLFAEGSERMLAVLEGLRARGIRISVDDFGTGYSSLGYLQRLPVDVLKVDRSFIADLKGGGDAIVGAIVTMAHALRLQTIIEGVETQAQLQELTALGATHMQGFLFARGMPVEQACAQGAVDWSALPNIPSCGGSVQPTLQPRAACSGC